MSLYSPAYIVVVVFARARVCVCVCVCIFVVFHFVFCVLCFLWVGLVLTPNTQQVLEEHFEVAQLLLDNGAILSENLDGETQLEWAEDSPEMYLLVSNHLAKLER